MGRITYSALFLCMAAHFVKAQFDAFVGIDPDAIVDDETVNDKFALLESRITALSEEAMKMIFPSITDIMSSLNISRSCFRDCAKLLLGLRKLNTWAVKFLDASTKSADGILNLDAPSLGSYDECVDNKVFYGRSKKVMFQGKYCNVHLRMFLKRNEKATLFGSIGRISNATDRQSESVFYEFRNVAPLLYFASLREGLCLPSGCSTDDANAMLRLVSDYLGISLKATTCVIKEEKKYTPLMITIMFIYSLTGFFALLGTVIDIYSYYFKKEYEGTGIQILRAFSFISNFKKLTNTPPSSNIACLNGMKFLSMSWIILAHGYMYHFLIHHTLPRNFEDLKKDLAFQAVISGFFAVDTFFFISGFLVCYATVKLVIIEKKGFSLKFYILHRLWRILPAYAFVIGFEFLKPLTGSGPLFHEVFLYDLELCKNNWWTNFLFINNFYRNEKICIPQSWFVAVDTQLYVLALIVLLPLIKWPKVGQLIAGLAVAAGMIVTCVMSYKDSIVGIFTLGGSANDLNNWHHYHNMSLHIHAAPFFIGLLLGYLLATRSEFKVPKLLQVLCWCLSVAVCLSVVYGPQKWNAGIRPTVLEIIFYSLFSRLGWALGIAWMTFCCSTGRGGVVNYILSWNMWSPLSKLTYFAFLVHVTVMLAYNGNLRTVPIFRQYFVVWIFLGHLVITYSVAFVGYILVESPFMSLEKIILFRNRKDGLSTLNESPFVLKDLEKNEENEEKNLGGLERNGKIAEKDLIINGFENKNARIPEKNNTHM